MRESEIIERLREIATDPAARGLADDAALVDGFVVTHDSIAEGVHFLAEDPPASVGWKLAAVNLSDLAGKGATPHSALLSLSMRGGGDWESGFLDGIAAACESYALALVGGDTIALPEGAPRVLGMTAIGRAGDKVPSRSGGRAGDRLWVVGTLGDSGAGLAQLLDDPKATGPLVDIYRRPIPLVEIGRVMAPQATAMMDVSDGLLLDLARLCAASGCSAKLDLDTLPLSDAFIRARGGGIEERLFAATRGDDYALLAALPPEIDPLALPLPRGARIRCVGTLVAGRAAIALSSAGRPVPLPERLGYEHRSLFPTPAGDRG